MAKNSNFFFCVNQTESVHGTLRFLYFSHLHVLYGICVKIFIINRIDYFKELHNDQKYN